MSCICKYYTATIKFVLNIAIIANLFFFSFAMENLQVLMRRVDGELEVVCFSLVDFFFCPRGPLGAGEIRVGGELEGGLLIFLLPGKIFRCW